MKKRGLSTTTIIIIVVAVLIALFLIYNYAIASEPMFAPVSKFKRASVYGDTTPPPTCTEGWFCSQDKTKRQHHTRDCRVDQTIPCASDEICVGGVCIYNNQTVPTHAVCSGEYCIIVNGTGTNECNIHDDCGTNQTN